METAEVNTVRAQIAAIVGSVGLILVIVELIRRKKLREEYSLIWLVSGVIMIVFSIWRDLLDEIAHAVGIGYSPALLFLVANFFGILLMIHFSVIISRQTEHIKTLAQEVAILKHEVKSLKDKKGVE